MMVLIIMMMMVIVLMTNKKCNTSVDYLRSIHVGTVMC